MIQIEDVYKDSLKTLITFIRAHYDEEKDFNKLVGELEEELRNNKKEDLADYLDCLRFNNGWRPM